MERSPGTVLRELSAGQLKGPVRHAEMTIEYLRKAYGIARSCDGCEPKRVSWSCDRSVTGVIHISRSGFPERRPRPSVTGMATIPTPPAEPQDSPDGYVGLERDRAERLARERGWSTVRSLAPGTIITMEYRVGRLNFEVREGTVTRAWKG